MANTKIFLVRHGLPEYEFDSQGRKLGYGPDAPLSQEGESQAQAIATKLPQPDIIISSPFRRAVETAEYIAAHHGIQDVNQMEVLADQQPINFEGQLLDDIIAGKIKAHPDDETDRMVHDRINNAFEKVLDENQGKKVAIVFHGHPIRYIVLKHVEGREMGETMPEDFMTKNYALQGEAWMLVFDENKNVIESRLIARDDNDNPGVGKW